MGAGVASRVGARAAGAASISGAAEAAAAFLAGAFLAGGGVAGAGAAGKASRSLRATGASIVDDADLTNSPFSFNQERTFLLSRPSSFASS